MCRATIPKVNSETTLSHYVALLCIQCGEFHICIGGDIEIKYSDYMKSTIPKKPIKVPKINSSTLQELTYKTARMKHNTYKTYIRRRR